VVRSTSIVPLPSLEYELFRRLIRDQFGLDYPPHKRDILGQRLERRLRAHGLRRYSEYYRMLRYADSSHAEWATFAEAVTNNETYFFREPYHFRQLAEVLPQLARGAAAPLRALSAGCSSGEEAYSIAMVLAACPAISAGFRVQGVDISGAKLDEARVGRYVERSFREDAPVPAGVDPSHFLASEVDGAHVVRGSLRARVSFAQANLADAAAVEKLGSFDIVFCRNVLIYADHGTLPRFLASLEKLVRPGGYLFLGHSESLLGRRRAFQPRRVGEQFTYVRAT
jgi:chemotaxis protein methyltransferase CheR